MNTTNRCTHCRRCKIPGENNGLRKVEFGRIMVKPKVAQIWKSTCIVVFIITGKRKMMPEIHEVQPDCP